MALDLSAHLKELCAAPGLSGYEAPVRDLLRAAWTPLVDEIRQDPLGSLIATRRGTGEGRAARPRLMVAAHMDAIGLLVTCVEGEFLRVTSIGGIDARVLPGQLVTVHGRRDLPGVVALPPPFLLQKQHRDGVAPTTELLIDTGLPAERLREQVEIGSLVSFAQPPRELQNGLLAAKSLDNRASLAALTVCLEALQGRSHAWDLLAVATVQEEVGLQGAAAAAFSLAPEMAVAVDVTWGTDANTREFGYRTFAVGGGPTLALGPNIHTGLHQALKAAAERAEVPLAVEVIWSGHSGTDAAAMQIARAGIPTAIVSIPLRNMHTPVEVVSLKDIQRTGRLLAEFVAGLRGDFLDTLSWE
jgi:putative aminopeptidase FrvX